MVTPENTLSNERYLEWFPVLRGKRMEMMKSKLKDKWLKAVRLESVRDRQKEEMTASF